MNETDWLTATDPGPMLQFVQGKVSERKLRLFAVECCHSIWHLLTDERSRRAVETAERFAEGKAKARKLRSAEKAAWDAGSDVDEDEAVTPSGVPAAYAAYGACCADAQDAAAYVCQFAYVSCGRGGEAYAVLLRCIAGNPFRQVAVQAAWLTPTVVELAHTIYEGRAYARLPILADALEEAGCDDRQVLEHCRRERVHARGCFVVDLVLGRT